MKRTDNPDYIKTQNFYVKDSVKGIRRQAMEWEKMFAKDTFEKGLCEIETNIYWSQHLVPGIELLKPLKLPK